jgi:ketopantoate reductase
MASELFKLMAGVNIVHIPYKSSGAAAAAIVSGQLQVMFATTGAATPHVKSGRLRALAISTLQPSELAPGLPTVAAAANLPGYESAAVAAVFAPARTQQAIVKRMNEEINRVHGRPEVKERFFNQGVEIVGGSPEHAAAFIRSDTATTARIIKEAGIRAGFQAKASEDVQADLWTKFVRLATWSGMTTVTRSPMGVVRDTPATFELMVQAIDEVIAVGKARGVNLPRDLMDSTLAMIKNFPASSKSSMLEDIERGRRLELPWLSGAVVRIGKEVGVPTPIHQFITTILTPFVNGTK